MKTASVIQYKSRSVLYTINRRTKCFCPGHFSQLKIIGASSPVIYRSVGATGTILVYII